MKIPMKIWQFDFLIAIPCLIITTYILMSFNQNDPHVMLIVPFTLISIIFMLMGCIHLSESLNLEFRE